MSVYLYTTCSVLTIGCPVYTNDSLTTSANNGQYYDGATCWTISGGIITGTGACTTTTTSTTTTTTTVTGFNVYMSICAEDSASNPNGVVNFTIYANTASGVFNSTNGELVDTNVTMSVTVTGNVHTFTSSSVVMGTSTKTVGGFFTGFNADEPILSIEIDSISPASFSSETYVIGDTQTVTGSCAV